MTDTRKELLRLLKAAMTGGIEGVEVHQAFGEDDDDDKDEDETKTLIGKVPAELVRKIHDNKMKTREIINDVERRTEEFHDNIRFEANLLREDLMDDHQAIWKEIYAQLGILKGEADSYTIDVTTREVFLLEKKEVVADETKSRIH